MKHFLFLFGSLVLLPLCFGEQDRKDKTIKAVVLGDLREVYESADYLDFLESIWLLDPDYVFSTGNFFPSIKQLKKISVADFLKKVKRLSAGLHISSGPHEYAYKEKEGLSKAFPSFFEKKDTFFTNQSNVFIFLSFNPQAENKISYTQIEWLKAIVEKAPDLSFFLFTHKAYWDVKGNGAEKKKQLQKTGWLEVEQIFHKKKVAVFSGHSSRWVRQIKNQNIYHGLPLSQSHDGEYPFYALWLNISADQYQSLLLKQIQKPHRSGLSLNGLEHFQLEGSVPADLSRVFELSTHLTNDHYVEVRFFAKWESGGKWFISPSEEAFTLMPAQTKKLNYRLQYLGSNRSYPPFPVLKLSADNHRPENELFIPSWRKAISNYQANHLFEIEALRFSHPPLIDGKLKEWEGKPTIEKLFHQNGGSIVKRRNRIWLGFQEKGLFIAFFFELSHDYPDIERVDLFFCTDKKNMIILSLIPKQQKRKGSSSLQWHFHRRINYMSMEAHIDWDALRLSSPPQKLNFAVSVQPQTREHPLWQFPPLFGKKAEIYQLAELRGK